MLRIIRFFYVVLLLAVQTFIGDSSLASDKVPVASPEFENVIIAPHALYAPMGRILLIRKSSEYCAVKFTKFWSENTSEVGSLFVASGADEYATYELYQQIDKTRDFSRSNVRLEKGKLSFPKPRGIGRFAFSIGRKEIKCGSIQLHWSGKCWLHFYGNNQKEGDYGVELAPTKWTDISQVKVFDSRLRWFRYEAKRKDINIPVDRLWDDKGDGR